MAKKAQERSFKYQKRTKEDIKTRANMKGGNYDSYIKPQYKQWKPKEGKNLIRILPPTWEGANHYGMDIFVNFNIGADKQAYLSLSKHNKGADPIAEARQDAQKEGEKKLADALRPSQRILYWIIDRTDEDAGPLLWAAPFGFDKSLSNLCIDEDTKEVIFIDDPVEGRDVRFYREGNGLNTTYEASKMKVLGKSTVHEDEGQENEWLDFIAENPLTEVLNFYPYEHIKAVFDGQMAASEDDDDAEDAKPARRGSRASADEEDDKPARRQSRARPSADSDDDEDVQKPARGRRPAAADDGDDEDDDVEEKAPPRTRQRAKPDPDDDDEVADEKPVRGKASRKPVSEPDDDDAEEDEKPVRRRRVADTGPEEEDDEVPPPRSRRGKTEPEDEDEGGSLRERLARRRSRNSDDD